MKFILIFVCLCLFSLLGCGATSDQIYLSPRPSLDGTTNQTVMGYCDTVSSVHFFTAVAGLMCWDKNGNPVQPANSAVVATSPSNMITGVIMSAAPVAASALISPTNNTKVSLTK